MNWDLGHACAKDSAGRHWDFGIGHWGLGSKYWPYFFWNTTVSDARNGS